MKISIKKVLIFFLMLYPILPVNYYLGNFSYANTCSIIIVILYCFGIKEKKLLNIFKQNTFFWIYLIVYSIFAFFTANMLISFAWIISTICVSLIIVNLVNTRNDFDLIIKNIILSSLILAFIGSVEAFSKVFLIQNNLLDANENIRYGLLRATGPFGICINFGMYQSIGATLLLYKILNNKKSNKKLYFIYCFIAFSIFLSVSRLAICMFLATQILIYYQNGINKKNIERLLFIITFFIVLLIILDVLGLEVNKLINDFIISLEKLFGFKNNSIPEKKGVIGFGNRIDLYKWVFEAVKDNFIFGNGIRAEFSYKLTDWIIKTSIEVNYLYVLYHCGIVGLLFLILSYINTIKYFYIHKNIKINEDVFSFCKVILILFIVYYICLFGIQETDLTRIYCEIVSLGLAYVKLSKKEG